MIAIQQAILLDYNTVGDPTFSRIAIQLAFLLSVGCNTVGNPTVIRIVIQ